MRMRMMESGAKRGGDIRCKKKAPLFSEACGAENETRTRDPDLGKVVLYQLSYFRDWDGRAKVDIIFEFANFYQFICRGIPICFQIGGIFLSLQAIYKRSGNEGKEQQNAGTEALEYRWDGEEKEARRKKEEE